ncbi:MAG: hypothetical protein GC156_15175 [Actinomycetales bacterium]|nr:hypothetical protein [Actinomycetales bacterium]
MPHEHSLGRGRTLAYPQFPDDDGSADPAVRALLASEADPLSVARALRDVRLVAVVMAVLEEQDEDGGDKDSHMAVVSMVNAAGEKGLLAFSGVDAATQWNPLARPVPALGRDTARAALDDGASAVVIDVGGPRPLVITGPALAVLADTMDFEAVAALVSAALAPLTSDGWVEVEVRDGRPAGAEADVLVRIAAPGGGHPDGRLARDLADQAARILGQRGDIQRAAPGGIGIVHA